MLKTHSPEIATNDYVYHSEYSLQIANGKLDLNQTNPVGYSTNHITMSNCSVIWRLLHSFSETSPFLSTCILLQETLINLHFWWVMPKCGCQTWINGHVICGLNILQDSLININPEFIAKYYTISQLYLLKYRACHDNYWKSLLWNNRAFPNWYL